MKKVAFWGLSLMLFVTFAAPGFAQTINDRVEYDAYMAVYNDTDFTKKAAAAEKFLVDYPSTTAKTHTYMMLIRSYVRIPKWDKALETADKQAQMAPTLSTEDKFTVLQIGMTAAGEVKNGAKLTEYANKILAIDAKNVGALINLSNFLAGSVPTDESKKEAHFTLTLEITNRTLALPKPAEIQAAQWNQIQLQLLHSTSLILLNQKKYAESIAESRKALAIDKKDGYAYYLIGLALKPAMNDAVRKYNTAVENYNKDRDKGQLVVDELKSVMEGAENAAGTRKDEVIDALARSVALGGNAAAEARKELQNVFTGTPDELTKIIADKKAELDANR